MSGLAGLLWTENTLIILGIVLVVLTVVIYILNLRHNTIKEKYINLTWNYFVIAPQVGFLMFIIYFSLLVPKKSPLWLLGLHLVACFGVLYLVANYFARKFRVVPFICPHCLKSVSVFQDWECPFCDTVNRQKYLFHKCKNCKAKLPAFDCPECEEQIDFEAPYNEKQLKAKRYEKV